MKSFIPLSIFFSSLVAAGSDKIVDLNSAKSLPKLPALVSGCEGECCGILKSKKALKDIQLFEEASTQSKKTSVLKKGETFSQADFFTKIIHFGEVLDGSKKLKVVIYLSEGIVLVWDGKQLREFDTTAGDEGESSEYKSPSTESWIKFKLKNGKSGWAKLAPKDGSELDYGWCG